MAMAHLHFRCRLYIIDTNVNTALAKETRSQWFSSSQYDTLIIEVGELVNIKSVTSEPETIAIGIVCSNDPSKEVGGKKIGSSFFEVIVKVSIKPDEQLIKPYGLFKTIGQVVGTSIAWPTAFLFHLQPICYMTEDMDRELGSLIEPVTEIDINSSSDCLGKFLRSIDITKAFESGIYQR
ncbi:hypothetical protein G4B88_004947 [Cannabis sativa]|uniref:Transposase Tnp1/En/Spm-like domain-containing protein n=1 Tax=Cannabis sativa TaxID=3483 RepID=A0A7J6FZG7_CANSA|nr:hypothetical protein G4B88_004947 [Cannabis sativa]